MLGIFPTPFDGALEDEYLEKERHRSRAIACSISILFLLYALAPILLFTHVEWFFSAIHIGVAAIVYAIASSRLYLRKPILDCALAAILWAVLVCYFFDDLRYVFRNAPFVDRADVNSACNFAMIKASVAAFYSAILFSGNFRNYFIYSIISMIVSIVGIFMLVGSEVTFGFAITLSLISVIANFVNREREITSRDQFMADKLLNYERERSENLLHNVLPEQVVDRLKDGEAVADPYADLTVIFADVVGFSALSKTMSPRHLLTVLNHFFSAADRCAERYGIEKVKTIGDTYLAVAGGVSSRASKSDEALKFAIDLLEEVRAMRDVGRIGLKVRIGMHTGPAIGGIIGDTRLAYDYWGDTLNIASRIEAAAPVNGIAVSPATYYELEENYSFESAQTVHLKGIGETQIYVLESHETADLRAAAGR